MSGTYLTTATRASPSVAYYGGGGGGGGGSSITASTITMNGPILMNNNTISLSTNGQSQLYYNSANSNTYLIGLSSPTDSVHIGTQCNANAFIVTDNTVSVNNTSNQSIRFSGGESNLSIQYLSSSQPFVTEVFQNDGTAGRWGIFNLNGPALTLTDQLYTAQISTANLTVSSINDAVYPPAIDGYTDTIPIGPNFVGGPQTIPAFTQIALTSSFNVISGHSYRVTTTKVALSNVDTNGNQQIVVNGTGQSPLPIIQTIPGTVTNANFAYAEGQYTGTWLQQGAGPCQVTLYNNSITQSTLITMNSIIGQPHLIEDLGVIV